MICSKYNIDLLAALLEYIDLVLKIMPASLDSNFSFFDHGKVNYALDDITLVLGFA